MRTNIVFTLTGTDRIGIVEEVTKVFLNLGGNVETSRMSRLGGEFAILLLVSMPREQLPGLEEAIGQLTDQGYKVTIGQTKQSYAETHPGWLPYQIEVLGADHEGIIYQIAHDLSLRGINIEAMDTETTMAPVSGSPLFSMTARVVIPPKLTGKGWEDALTAIGKSLNVDITVSAINEH